MKSKRLGFAVASLVCVVPCISVTAYAVWFSFLVKHSPENFDRYMAAAWIALWLSPLALASLVLGAFARGFRPVCVGMSALYFAGWIAMLLLE
jgi:hypothetical protein